MTLPVQSVRAASEHRDVLRTVARMLREGRADELRRLLSDRAAQPVGPFRSEAAALAFLRDRLVSALRPRMIWLFGSRAREKGRLDSDFDLLVVLPDGLPDSAYGHSAVAEPVSGCGVGHDIVPCSWSAYLAERKEVGSLVHRAVSEGRLIYRDRQLRRADAREA
jgi:hypothetical protein